jgi:hypothetical protein
MSPIPKSSAITSTTLGRSAAWMLEVEKRVKEVVAQSIAIVMPRSERSEKKTINVFMM